ncbi:hypothetical protein [Aquabacter spiritensis]|uniref:AtuA-like ferredoxin-fold domain-containing protein n=1 Tax=Aquabacter spiritensis TaxID=933073 RepID=A0A4R3LYS2_9HYPH|nr:hypothetical protein [Aquabacter spiritensis]TCT05623.1 hypothetical protein EDC64_104180 [Aquabacter spiritensis]
MTGPILLRQLAFARTGDKGNRLNIAVICRTPRAFPVLAEGLTPARVAAHFAARRPSRVVRYDLPNLAAFNFVLDDVLDGGVNASLGLDGHGKSLSFHLLALELAPSAAILAALRDLPAAPEDPLRALEAAFKTT